MYHFDQKLDAFVQQYAKAQEPRYMFIMYIKKCKKPRDVDPRAHVMWIELMCKYAIHLQGTHQELKEEEIKKLIFETSPICLQQDNKKAKWPLPMEIITEMVEFMKLCKDVSDVDERRHNGKKHLYDDIK